MLSMPLRSVLLKRRILTPIPVKVYKKVSEMSPARLSNHISTVSSESYGQQAKDLQIKAVSNLVAGRNTFLLAGTGFGKSRIAELYHKMMPSKSPAVVIVLNPLDSLGDNQVLEKFQAGFTAINLTKLTLNPTTAKEIQAGLYNFVYLSPKIFLNSKIFCDVYFSTEFQKILALVVVDEAHMIYVWGLVESNPGKKSISAHFRLEDYGIFRPSYGKLGAQLLFRNEKPILLLSATCRPIAVDAILRSLKLTHDNIDIIRGELTRPEIWIVRATMDNSLASSLDVIKIFPSSKDVVDADMVPSLVYSGLRNRTKTVLEVIDRARETPGGSFVPKSSCARRFHSCTGEEDKVTTVEDFANGLFPVISCTMALGLGQNWKRVRMVAHVGRGDPASICQMIGRCGRDGNAGLAILFVEKTRRGGKNCLDQFTQGDTQSDLDRMDTLAITTLCLRVAFSMDNLYGYVPLWADDPQYVKEVERQTACGMPKCQCSNCEVEAGHTLLNNLPWTSKHNFDRVLDGSFVQSMDYNIKHKYPSKGPTVKKRKFTTNDAFEMEDFSSQLIQDLYTYYDSEVSPGGTILAADIFGKEESQAILASLDHIHWPQDLRTVIGGDCFEGKSDWLFRWITNYKSSQPTASSLSVHTDPAPKKTKQIQSNAKAGSQKQLGLGLPPKVTSKKAQAAKERHSKKLEKLACKENDLAMKARQREQIAAIMASAKGTNS